MARGEYDAILVTRTAGMDDVNALRQGLEQLRDVSAELVSVVPDPRGWILVMRLPV